MADYIRIASTISTTASVPNDSGLSVQVDVKTVLNDLLATSNYIQIPISQFRYLIAANAPTGYTWFGWWTSTTGTQTVAGTNKIVSLSSSIDTQFISQNAFKQTIGANNYYWIVAVYDKQYEDGIPGGNIAFNFCSNIAAIIQTSFPSSRSLTILQSETNGYASKRWQTGDTWIGKSDSYLVASGVSGYIFGGWYSPTSRDIRVSAATNLITNSTVLTGNQISAQGYPLGGNPTVYWAVAKYIQRSSVSYSIKYELNNHGTSASGNPTTLKLDQSGVIKAPTDNDFNFAGWKLIDGSYTNKAQYSVNGITWTYIYQNTIFGGGRTQIYVRNLRESINATVTLSAVWERKDNCVVMFNAMGGSVVGTSDKFVVVRANEKYTIPSSIVAEKSGIVFDHWSSSETSDTPVTSITPQLGLTIVYAIYRGFTICFVDPTGVNQQKFVTYDSNTDHAIPSISSGLKWTIPEGYTFDPDTAWIMDNSSIADGSVIHGASVGVGGIIELSWNLSKIEFDVTFVISEDPEEVITVKRGYKSIIGAFPDIPMKDGMKVSRWIHEDGTEALRSEIITNSISLFAEYAPATIKSYTDIQITQ